MSSIKEKIFNLIQVPYNLSLLLSLFSLIRSLSCITNYFQRSHLIDSIRLIIIISLVKFDIIIRILWFFFLNCFSWVSCRCLSSYNSRLFNWILNIFHTVKWLVWTCSFSSKSFFKLIFFPCLHHGIFFILNDKLWHSFKRFFKRSLIIKLQVFCLSQLI